MCTSRFPRAGFQIVFQIAVLRGTAAELLHGSGDQRRAAEIGVQDDASGIDHWPQRMRQHFLHESGNALLERCGIKRRELNVWLGRDFASQFTQNGASDFKEPLAIHPFREGDHARLHQQFVHGRNPAQQAGLCGGHNVLGARLHWFHGGHFSIECCREQRAGLTVPTYR